MLPNIWPQHRIDHGSVWHTWGIFVSHKQGVGPRMCMVRQRWGRMSPQLWGWIISCQHIAVCVRMQEREEDEDGQEDRVNTHHLQMYYATPSSSPTTYLIFMIRICIFFVFLGMCPRTKSVLRTILDRRNTTGQVVMGNSRDLCWLFWWWKYGYPPAASIHYLPPGRMRWFGCCYCW